MLLVAARHRRREGRSAGGRLSAGGEQVGRDLDVDGPRRRRQRRASSRRDHRTRVLGLVTAVGLLDDGREHRGLVGRLVQHPAPDPGPARARGMSVAITSTGWREAQASPTAASVLARRARSWSAPPPAGRSRARSRRPRMPPSARGVRPRAGSATRSADARARGCGRPGARRPARRPRPRAPPLRVRRLSACPSGMSSPDQSLQGRPPLRVCAWRTCRACSRARTARWCSPTSAPTSIKVERPQGGDETRGWGPPFAAGEAAYFLSVNRGKRSCALDLASEEGGRSLSSCAPAPTSSSRTSSWAGPSGSGSAYEQVHERNPRVVYCSITGFGSAREPRGRPATTSSRRRRPA